MTPTPPLKCECEKPDTATRQVGMGNGVIIREPFCRICGLPIHPTAEPKHPDSCTASVKEPSYMHSEECPLRRPTTKPKPYKSWEETWLEDVPMPSPVDGEWEKELTVIAKNVFLLHSVPPQMREAFAVFILRVAKLITSLLHTRNMDKLEEKVRAEERERIVKICEEKMEQKYHCKEYYSALSEIRDNLTNNV